MPLLPPPGCTTRMTRLLDFRDLQTDTKSHPMLCRMRHILGYFGTGLVNTLLPVLASPGRGWHMTSLEFQPVVEGTLRRGGDGTCSRGRCSSRGGHAGRLVQQLLERSVKALISISRLRTASAPLVLLLDALMPSSIQL